LRKETSCCAQDKHSRSPLQKLKCL